MQTAVIRTAANEAAISDNGAAFSAGPAAQPPAAAADDPVTGRSDSYPELALKMDHFEGPLDLLMHLIEKNRIDIYNIPIEKITDQYLVWLEHLQQPDMEVASEFLVMAATLLHIKSRLLLPQRLAGPRAADDDPREELILRLLAYRRCKALAGNLKDRYGEFSRSQYKPPESPATFGMASMTRPERLNRDAFWTACRRLVHQNQNRFNDLSGKITHLLQREKISIKEKMRLIWHQALARTCVFFNELFPASCSRAERVTGFLALLELLKLGRINVRQDYPFDVILIEPCPEPSPAESGQAADPSSPWLSRAEDAEVKEHA